MRPRFFSCFVVLAAVLLPAAAAEAATVHVSESPRDGVSTLMVTGGAAADDVTLRANASSSVIGPLDITVSDPGVAVTPDGSGCIPAGAHAVHCTGEDGPHAIVRTGVGDDRVRLRTAPGGDRIEQVRVLLGVGDDRVEGNASFLNANGGPGDDVLRGGAGQDRLDGGGGHDDLDGGGMWDVLLDGDDPDHPDADVLDGGGPGQDDLVDYTGRRRGVDVDLMRRRGNGQPGEGDRLAHFEGVMGGHGNDRLAGTGGSNYVFGGGGNDLVRGRGGRDEVFADSGSFRLGAGGDEGVLLHVGAGTVACGRGRDVVAGVLGRHGRPAGPGPLLRPDCERYEPDVLLRGARQRLTGAFPAQPMRRREDGRLTFSLPPVSVNGFRGHRAPGRLELTSGRRAGRVLDRVRLGPRGHSRFSRRRVVVTLPPGRAAAARRRPIVVGLRLRLRGEPEIRWRVLVRLPHG